MNSINGFTNSGWSESNPFEIGMEMETGLEQPDEIEIEVPENEMSEAAEDGDESQKLTLS